MPGTYNLSFTTGDTVEFEVALKNPDESPKDLTGYTAKAQIRSTTAAADVLAEFNVVGSLDSTGKIRLRLESTQTEVFRATPQGVWDLEVTKTADLTKLTILTGTVRTTPDVTRE